MKTAKKFPLLGYTMKIWLYMTTRTPAVKPAWTMALALLTALQWRSTSIVVIQLQTNFSALHDRGIA